MKQVALTLTIILVFGLNLIAQMNNNSFRYFFKVDSTYVMVDNEKENWYTLEFKADTVIRDEENIIFYNNKKLLQINVIPFSEILPNQKKPITISEALQAYKKWEIDYQQKSLNLKLKNGEEFYYRNNKPFLIWWQKIPPDSENESFVDDEKDNDIDSGTVVDVKTYKVSYMLRLNFSIYGERNVAFSIPVFEDEDLKEEIEKLKEIANTLRVYGGYIDMGILMDLKKSKEPYILRDSLNYIEVDVPEWANILKPIFDNSFAATFPEYHEAVNAMMMRWEYKSDSVTFDDFINRSKSPHELNTNYRLIEKTDSTYKYYYTSEDDWFHQQFVYLKGDNIYCLINFTATKNSYAYNISRFDEFIKKIKLK